MHGFIELPFAYVLYIYIEILQMCTIGHVSYYPYKFSLAHTAQICHNIPSLCRGIIGNTQINDAKSTDSQNFT